MSTELTNVEPKTVTPREFWGQQRNRDVFNLFKTGKSVVEISEVLGIRPDTVINIVTHDSFRAKLDKFLAATVYMHQTASILALDDISKKLWARVRTNMDEIPPEICIRELTKIISSKGSPKVINPKQYNVVFNDLKDNSDKAKEIFTKIVEDNLGFDPLPDRPDSEYHTIDVPPEAES